jgi:hypothetical protein
MAIKRIAASIIIEPPNKIVRIFLKQNIARSFKKILQ